MKEKLEEAIALAVEIHRGQRDKAGDVYILHPLRLMARMKSDVERMAAVLHDVVEDSEGRVTFETLRGRGFPEEVVSAVECLTKREAEDYLDFVGRCARHPIARRVKLADLEDNLDVRRLATVDPRDAERLNRYIRAWRMLAE